MRFILKKYSYIRIRLRWGHRLFRNDVIYDYETNIFVLISKRLVSQILCIGRLLFWKFIEFFESRPHISCVSAGDITMTSSECQGNSNPRQLNCLFNVITTKHQRPASLALCEGNPPMIGGSPHQGPVMPKTFPCHMKRHWRLFIRTELYHKWVNNVSIIMHMKTKDYGEHRLTHWGQVTHICVGNLTIIGSDNGLSPGRRQAIIWTNAGIFLIGPLGTNFSEMLIEIPTLLFKKIHFKMSSGKWRPFCLGPNVLSNPYPWMTRTST